MTFALAFLAVACLSESAQPPIEGVETPPRVIAAAKLLEDVDILQSVYESVHPGLYRYNTKSMMREHFQTLRAELSRDRTLAETYLALSRFLAKVKCGHTYANFFNQPKDVAQALFAGRNRVPFAFRWIDRRMIVTRSLSAEAGIKPGSEILAMNGIKVQRILEELLTVARADGGNDAKRIAYLEVTGSGKYEAFDIFLPLFHPEIGDRIELSLIDPGSKDSRSLVVSAQDFAQRQAIAERDLAPSRDGSAPLWKFEKLDERITYLRMPSWALYNSKWGWRSFLESGVDELIEKRVAGLIVDLRGNEGGFDIGDRLIARIAAKPIRRDRYDRVTRYRSWPLPKTFDAYLDTWDWSFKDWGASATEDRSGFFRLSRDGDEVGDAIAPRGRRFEGSAAVLIDASNSSATFQFAKLVKENRLGALVGRTTGGNQRGINGGASFFVTLPNSRIEVDLPLIATFPGKARPNGDEIVFQEIPDAGIDPDVPVAASIEDIAAGIDTDLQAAKKWLSAAPR